jgi:S1-C subfamily serine protease
VSPDGVIVTNYHVIKTKASTTLDLYSQAIDASKLAAQRDIAIAITSHESQAN